MKSSLRRPAGFLLAAAWAFVVWVQLAVADEIHLVILHLNDVHGKLEPFADPSGKSVGGMARVATLVKRVRDENPNRVLFLDAGDVLSRGNALTIRDGGDLSLHLLEVMGLDALTPGNGDFYFGLENLLRLSSKVKFPVIDANLTSRGTGKAPFAPFVIKEVAGLKIAILGLGFIHVELPSARTLDLRDPVATAKQLVPGLRQKAGLVLALTHINVGEDTRLATEVPEIDLIVGGHSHTRLDALKRVKKARPPGETFIAQAWEYGQFLGRVDLRLNRTGESVQIEGAEGRLLPIDESVPEDPEIAGLLKAAHPALDEVIYTSEVSLANPPSGPNPTGDLVCEAVRAGTGADVAWLDRGAVRAGILPGKGTWWSICRIHPWRNQVLLLTCTGAQIQEALSKLDLLFAGCSFRTETAQPPNSAAPLVEDLKIGGAPVDLNRSYTVAVADYLFWMKPLLKDMPYRDTGERVDTLLAKYLHGLGVLRGTPWR